MSQSNYFQAAGEHERIGRLDKALYALVLARRDPERRTMAGLIDDNIRRVINKAARMTHNYVSDICPLYEQTNNPRNYILDANTLPVVSLTSISTRIERVGKTIQTILDQTVKPHSVNLYISEEPYLIDQGIPANAEVLMKLSDLGVNVYHVKNIGPYRKQYPVIAQLRQCQASPLTPIITIDDDVIYPPDIIERLMGGLMGEEAVIAHRGREISFDGASLAGYKSFPPPSAYSSNLNMGTGKNGIVYRLGYFPKNQEDFIGPILAPTADDIWCKWVTAIYCIPTLILEPRAAFDPSLDFKESEPADKNGLFHKYNAKGINDEAIANLETYFSSRGENFLSIFGGDRNV